MATPDGRIIQGDTTGLLVAPVGQGLNVNVYLVPEISAEPVTMQMSLGTGSSAGGPVIWGYEAADSSARILAYHARPPVTPTADCVPPTTPTYDNGRGIAYDPVDGNLWYTSVTFAKFLGDGLIRKTTPPQTGQCTLVNQIPFGDGPGGTIQDDIGALDIDGESRHTWAAGYKAVTVAGERRSYLYLVNRNNGSIIRSCWLSSRDGGVGNDTLVCAHLDNLPGSGQCLWRCGLGRHCNSIPAARGWNCFLLPLRLALLFSCAPSSGTGGGSGNPAPVLIFSPPTQNAGG
jgi:hypothetical protein